jgi:hypothetical protein
VAAEEGLQTFLLALEQRKEKGGWLGLSISASISKWPHPLVRKMGDNKGLRKFHRQPSESIHLCFFHYKEMALQIQEKPVKDSLKNDTVGARQENRA